MIGAQATGMTRHPKPGTVAKLNSQDRRVYELTHGELERLRAAIRNGYYETSHDAAVEGEQAYRAWCVANRRPYLVILHRRRRAMVYMDLSTARLVLPREDMWDLIYQCELSDLNASIEWDALAVNDVPRAFAIRLLHILQAKAVGRAVPWVEGDPVRSPRVNPEEGTGESSLP